MLLLFITAMTSTLRPVQGASPQIGEDGVKTLRAWLLGMGGTISGAVLLTYLALGVGLLKSLDFFTRQHVPARLGALLAILFGLWMLKHYFPPNLGWWLQAPGRLGSVAQQMAQKTTLPALITGGFLIGLCTVPCSGAVAGLRLPGPVQPGLRSDPNRERGRGVGTAHAQPDGALEPTPQGNGAPGAGRWGRAHGPGHPGDHVRKANRWRMSLCPSYSDLGCAAPSERDCSGPTPGW